MAQNVFHPDAWTRAKNRFVEDLTAEEKVRIYQREGQVEAIKFTLRGVSCLLITFPQRIR